MTDIRDYAPLAGALGVGGLLIELARRGLGWRSMTARARRDEAEARKTEFETSPEARLHVRTIDLLKELIESQRSLVADKDQLILAQSLRIAESTQATKDMNAEIQRMAQEIEDLRDHVDALADELRKHNLPVPARRKRPHPQPAAAAPPASEA